MAIDSIAVNHSLVKKIFIILAEVWDIDIVSSKYGVGPLESTNRYEGYVQIDDHSLEVIDASLSPDGTAIATASLDGFVKFFQVQVFNLPLIYKYFFFYLTILYLKENNY